MEPHETCVMCWGEGKRAKYEGPQFKKKKKKHLCYTATGSVILQRAHDRPQDLKMSLRIWKSCSRLLVNVWAITTILTSSVTKSTSIWLVKNTIKLDRNRHAIVVFSAKDLGVIRIRYMIL